MSTNGMVPKEETGHKRNFIAAMLEEDPGVGIIGVVSGLIAIIALGILIYIGISNLFES